MRGGAARCFCGPEVVRIKGVGPDHFRCAPVPRSQRAAAIQRLRLTHWGLLLLVLVAWWAWLAWHWKREQGRLAG